jgi:hypothetical protein
LQPFWPDLFSTNHQLPFTLPSLHQTPITQHHISNQMFPLPYVSDLGRKAHELIADAPRAEDTDMMDIDTIDNFFDFGKYADEADENQEPSLHPRDSISNQFTPQVGVEASLRLSIGSSTPKKVLRPFEQLKASEETGRYGIQQRKRTKTWLDGIASESQPWSGHSNDAEKCY